MDADLQANRIKMMNLFVAIVRHVKIELKAYITIKVEELYA